MNLIYRVQPHDMTAAPSLFLNVNPQTAQWKWIGSAFAGWSLISPSRRTLAVNLTFTDENLTGKDD